MTTASEHNGWTNIETWNTHLNLGSHSKGMEQTILRVMRGQNPIKFADNLETYLWIIWEGMTPDGYNLKPVNWVEIADFWLNEYGMEC